MRFSDNLNLSALRIKRWQLLLRLLIICCGIVFEDKPQQHNRKSNFNSQLTGELYGIF
jgi:hypothetical protein